MQKVKVGPETFLYPLPAVLVGAMVAGKPNFMTAAWCGVAASTPPAVSVSLRRARYTYEGVNSNGTFSINVPSTDLVVKVDYCGIYSGRRRDKSELFEVHFGVLKTAPLIQECPVNLACKVIQRVELKSHVVFIGEIVETYVREACMTGDRPDPVKIDPLIYATGSSRYHRLGETIARAFHVGKDQPA